MRRKIECCECEKALKKETGANFDVKFEGYTTSSIKRGVFKSLGISTKDMKIDDFLRRWAFHYANPDFLKIPMGDDGRILLVKFVYNEYNIK